MSKKALCTSARAGELETQCKPNIAQRTGVGLDLELRFLKLFVDGLQVAMLAEQHHLFVQLGVHRLCELAQVLSQRVLIRP